MSVARLWPLLLLGACAETPTSGPVSNVRYYQVDLTGQAQRCAPSPEVSPAAGGTTEAKIDLINDGGWCGVTVAQAGPKPFDVGLLATRPAHGRARVQTVGDKTRIDYIPDRAYSGADAFAVRLLPGGATVRVAVNVTPGPTPAVVPAAAPPAPATPPARTPRPRRP